MVLAAFESWRCTLVLLSVYALLLALATFVEKNYGLTKCWNRWQGISCRGGICVEENCVFEGEARPMQELCLWESMV